MKDFRRSVSRVVCRSIAVILGVGAVRMAMAQMPPTLATMSPALGYRAASYDVC